MNELWRALEDLKKFGENADWRNIFSRFRKHEIYMAYLDSNAWKHKREERKLLDNYRCNQCPRVNNLTVHHLSYARLGDELMEDLITLCDHCHHTHHGLERSLETQATQAIFSTKRGSVLTKIKSQMEARGIIGKTMSESIPDGEQLAKWRQ